MNQQESADFIVQLYSELFVALDDSSIEDALDMCLSWHLKDMDKYEINFVFNIEEKNESID